MYYVGMKDVLIIEVKVSAYRARELQGSRTHDPWTRRSIPFQMLLTI